MFGLKQKANHTRRERERFDILHNTQIDNLPSCHLTTKNVVDYAVISRSFVCSYFNGNFSHHFNAEENENEKNKPTDQDRLDIDSCNCDVERASILSFVIRERDCESLDESQG